MRWIGLIAKSANLNLDEVDSGMMMDRMGVEECWADCRGVTVDKPRAREVREGDESDR